MIAEPCSHDRLLMPSFDFAGKYYCRGCEKRFTLTEFVPPSKCQCKSLAELCFHCPPERANGTLHIDCKCLQNVGPFKVCIDPKMPETEIRMRDEQTGKEVVLCNVKLERDYFTKAEVDERITCAIDGIVKYIDQKKHKAKKRRS